MGHLIVSLLALKSAQVHEEVIGNILKQQNNMQKGNEPM